LGKASERRVSKRDLFGTIYFETAIDCKLLVVDNVELATIIGTKMTREASANKVIKSWLEKMNNYLSLYFISTNTTNMAPYTI
jgi:hypothetical protein